MNKKLLSIIIPLAIITLFLAKNKVSNSDNSPQIIPKKVYAVHPKSISINTVRTYPGTTLADNQSTLSFKVKGLVNNIPHKAPKAVNKGEVLAQLDKTDLILKRNELLSSIDGAEAKVNNALNHLERVKKLWQKGHTPDQQYDDSLTAFKLANSQLNTLINSLKTIDQQIEYTQLMAPFDGVISLSHVRSGENIREGQPILDIYPENSLEVRVFVPETIIGALNIGDIALVSFPALGNKAYKFEIIELSRASSNRLGFPIILSLPSPPSQLHPGLSAQVTFTIANQNSYLSVPSQAVLNDFENSFVYVVKDTTSGYIAQKSFVEAHMFYEDCILVTKGLTEMALVITEGQHQIEDQQPINILDYKGHVK